MGKGSLLDGSTKMCYNKDMLKQKGNKMTIKEALKIINDRCDVYGMSLLDMAIVMREQMYGGELNAEESDAIQVFLKDANRFFAPV
jgi:hypothetical protein